MNEGTLTILSTHGPLIHKRQSDKVIEHIEDAKSKGAKVIVGGERGEGTIVQPTILTNVTTDCVSSSDPICMSNRADAIAFER